MGRRGDHDGKSASSSPREARRTPRTARGKASLPSLSGGGASTLVATKYEASANAVLCNLFLVKDGMAIKEGDRAATKTP